MMDDLDWRWVKSFVAVATHENLSAAATASRTSAPTLSRHVALLEGALGVELFDRGGRGLQLSAQGTELFQHARRMSESAATLTRDAMGLSTQTTGSVRVTMTETFGAYFAPAWLKACRREHATITIELVLDDSAADLLLKEAEIAVRLFEPRQGELVMRRCGYQARGAYASAGYLARRGRPADPSELDRHDIVGFDRSTIWRESAHRAGLALSHDDFICCTDSHLMHPLLVAEGLGIGILQHFAARQLGLVRVLEEIEIAGGPVFLATHASLRTNALVSTVWQHLSQALEATFGETGR